MSERLIDRPDDKPQWRAARAIAGIAAPPLTLAAFAAYDTIIDVRTPAEFALDHLTGAVNYPVLNNDERIIVGTLYKQTSSFEAKKTGAAMVAKNIARHIEEHLHDKPKNWRPLIYCWRGGARSAALTHICRQIGWDAAQLEGGYKKWRAVIVLDLKRLPSQFNFIAICGKTGSGKSRLLDAISAQGAQVLDLEALAAHKGSVLGELPDRPQPSQKMFESAIWARLSSFDAALPVYVEAESKKIGRLQVPDGLIAKMYQAKCVVLETNDDLRLPLLREEYAHLIAKPEVLIEKLSCLAGLHPVSTISRWHDWVEKGDFDALISSLLHSHYDPAYSKSMYRNYARLTDAKIVTLQGLDEHGFGTAAIEALAPLPMPT